MSNKKLNALVTCEVTEAFLAAMRDRDIVVNLSGWGQTGNILSSKELIELAQPCEIVIVEIEELNSEVLSSLPNLKFIGVSRGTPVNIDLGFCEQQRIEGQWGQKAFHVIGGVSVAGQIHFVVV